MRIIIKILNKNKLNKCRQPKSKTQNTGDGLAAAAPETENKPKNSAGATEGRRPSACALFCSRKQNRFLLSRSERRNTRF